MLKKIVFSGIQPSGSLTIGNYIGALNQWVNIQDKFNCIYCIADLHAITIQPNSDILRKNVFDTLALYLACGINPSKSIIFIQSHVSEHSQLNWILNCYTNFNELRRMTQFKNKYKNLKKNTNCGILNYPILMASDVLLYQTNFIPVGADQKQHIELIKSIAYRFNNKFNDDQLFKIPKPLILKRGSRIMSLINTNKKMSKSDINKNNVIFLLEEPELIVKKIHQAVTDSDNPPLINYNIKEKAGISNLLNILSAISGKSILVLETEFKTKMYSQLKHQTSEYLCDLLVSIQKKYYFYRKNKDLLKTIIENGAKKAKIHAQFTIEKVYKSIGLI